MSQPTLPLCRSCGACCVHSSEFVPVTAKEARGLAMSLLSMTTDAGQWDTVERPPYVMRSVDGRCCALEGEVGESVRCRIYDQRPQVCRTLQRGSRECCYLVGYHHLGRPW